MADSSAWAPLRNRAYLMLWSAQLGINIGVWMQTVGAQWFLVTAGASAVFVTLVQTASTFPFLILGLPAGVFADSRDRRFVMLLANGLAAVSGTLLTIAAWTHFLNPVALLIFTFILGCGVALNSPTWQAIVPSLVPREQIPAAASLSSITINAARAIGPAAAGFLVAWAGVPVVFAVNAAAFILSVIIVVLWKNPVTPPAHPEHIMPALSSGIRYLRAAPHVNRLLFRTALFIVPASAIWALLPVVADERLKLTSSGYGSLLFCLGIGAVSGVFVLPLLQRKLSDNQILVVSSLCFGIGTVGTAILPFWGAGLTLILAGISWMCNFTTFTTLIQLTVAPWVRARAMATYLLIVMAGQALGSPLWGTIATLESTSVSLFIAAGLLLIFLPISVRIWPVRPHTGELDRSLDGAHHDLSMADTIDPAAGPVYIQISYRVPADNANDFITAMERVRLSRMRTGATDWHLTHRLREPVIFFERYCVPTWGEYLLQQHARMTGNDRENITAAMEFISDKPRIRRELPADVSIDGIPKP